MGIQVVVADDHQIVRQSLRALLEREGFTVVGEAANGQKQCNSPRLINPTS